MLAALHRARSHRGYMLAPILGALALGGVLTVSKVFLLAALPLALFQYIALRGHRGIRLFGPPALLAAFATVPGSEELFAGPLEQIGRQVERADSNLLGTLTANRLGSESTLAPVVGALIDGPIWFGYGAQGLSVAYDNGWVEAMVVAGIAGLICHGALLAILTWAWHWTPRGNGARNFLGGLTALAALASLGIPSFTANRVSLLLWILLGTLLFVARLVPDESRSADPSSLNGSSTDQEGAR